MSRTKTVKNHKNLHEPKDPKDLKGANGPKNFQNNKDLTIPRELKLYKIPCGKSVSVRKPKKSLGVFIEFRVTLPPKCTVGSHQCFPPPKKFLQYIISDVAELNFLRNDVGFLLQQIYGDRHSSQFDVSTRDGWIFYVWVYFVPPNPHSPSQRGTLPKDIVYSIFPFDLMFVKRRLSLHERNKIVDLLKKDVQAWVYYRRPTEPAECPFHITAVPGG